MYLNQFLILKKLQQTNAHLGFTLATKDSRWSQFKAYRAQSYVYGLRGGRTVINLDYTITSLRRACNVIQLLIESGGHLLFVNTNSKYNKIIRQTANKTRQSYINHKWIGGFLTNWNNMRSVQQQYYEARSAWRAAMRPPLRATFSKPLPLARFSSVGPSSAKLSQDSFARSETAKNLARFQAFGHEVGRREATSLIFDPRYKKMQKCFEGSSEALIDRLPDCIIVLNANQNSTAIYEAHLNQIPIIALVDSNIPNKLYNLITFPIPVNCESVYFIYLFCNCILKTILKSS